MRVGQPALVAAGLPAGVDPARLQLYADGIEQSIVVTGNGDATFSADEAVEFYGIGRDTLWTDTRSYWLIAGARGARVSQLTAPAGAAGPANFKCHGAAGSARGLPVDDPQRRHHQLLRRDGRTNCADISRPSRSAAWTAAQAPPRCA